MDKTNVDVAKKKRVYQVAKEFNVANETLIDFLKSNSFKVRNHMAPISEKMYEAACQQFAKEENQPDKSTDFRKKLQELVKDDAAREKLLKELGAEDK